MKKLYQFSGITISLFIVLHLCNHLSSVWGAETHIELMNTLRVIYRNIFVETLLLTCILIQITSGIRLFLAKLKLPLVGFAKLQMWSGLYLAFFFIIHLSAIFVGRFIFDLDTNFYFGVAGLNAFPLVLFFGPYYSLSIMAFFGHIASIHTQKMQFPVFGLSPAIQAKFILGSGFVLTCFIIYGLTNGFAGVVMPK